MKNLETLSATVEDGQIVLDTPSLSDGTDVELQIIDTKSEPQEVENTYNTTAPNDYSFDSLGLINQLIDRVRDLGYREPTPVQQKSIPVILQNHDLMSSAQTGSGKSAAFILPILQKLSQNQYSGKKYPRALILTPTRELASQIADNVDSYGNYLNLRHVVIYGGVSQRPQVKALKKGIDIIVATPGRLMDLMHQGHVELDQVSMFILDEADRMLDMGFIGDIRKILRKLPSKKQVLLFSATLPQEIQKLGLEIQDNPKHIIIDGPASTVESIESYVYFVEKEHKYRLLIHLLSTGTITKTLIFMRTKRHCDRLVKKLKKRNFHVGVIHGDKSQRQRERALDAFREGNKEILIGTDVAARGIDIDDISHIINYNITNEPEVYIHRVGRTARAGRSGVAYNFCSSSERKYLKNIELLIEEHLIRVEDNPYQSNRKRPKKTHIRNTGKISSTSSANRATKQYNRVN